MIGPGFLLRMARWARHPPSAARIRVMAVVVAVCALIWGIELQGWWPDWLAVNGRAKLSKP